MGSWVELEPGRWWQAYGPGDWIGDVIVAVDGAGFDASVTGPGGVRHLGAWRHDPRDARNAALAALRARGLTTPPDEPTPGAAQLDHPIMPHELDRMLHAAEAPTAPSEPDEGAVSPAGPGEAVRPRVGAWERRERDAAWLRPVRPYDRDDFAAIAYVDGAWSAWHAGMSHPPLGVDAAPTLDAAKAAADAALEAAGYVLEGGAHVDPGAQPLEADDHRRALVIARGGLGYVAEVWPDSLEHGRRDTGPTLTAALKRAIEDLDTMRGRYGLDGVDLRGDACWWCAGPVNAASITPARELAEARADVERLTRERDEVAKALGPCWVAGRPMMDAIRALEDAHGERVDTLIAERDDARAEVERLKADLDTVVADRDRYRAGYERVGAHAPGALLDRIAEALGIPGDWRDYADGVLEVTAADWREQAKRHEDAATEARGEVAVLREALARLTEQAESADDAARVVLRCEPGDVAGAALALQRERDLARGEVAGLERALRVVAEVRRG